jgi:hypothetical protein
MGSDGAADLADERKSSSHSNSLKSFSAHHALRCRGAGEDCSTSLPEQYSHSQPHREGGKANHHRDQQAFLHRRRKITGTMQPALCYFGFTETAHTRRLPQRQPTSQS